jgi:hypothetical protein
MRLALKSLEFLALFCHIEDRVACADTAVWTRPYTPFMTVALNPLAFSVWVRFGNRRPRRGGCATARMERPRVRSSRHSSRLALSHLGTRIFEP